MLVIREKCFFHYFWFCFGFFFKENISNNGVSYCIFNLENACFISTPSPPGGQIRNLFCDPWHRKSRNISGYFLEKKTKQSSGFRTPYPNLYRAAYSSLGFGEWLEKAETEHDFPCSLHINQESPGKTSHCLPIKRWRDGTTHQSEISPFLRRFFLWEGWKRQVTQQCPPWAPSKQFHGQCVSLGKASKWIWGKSSHKMCWGKDVWCQLSWRDLPAICTGWVVLVICVGCPCPVHPLSGDTQRDNSPCVKDHS